MRVGGVTRPFHRGHCCSLGHDDHGQNYSVGERGEVETTLFSLEGLTTNWTTLIPGQWVFLLVNLKSLESHVVQDVRLAIESDPKNGDWVSPLPSDRL